MLLQLRPAIRWRSATDDPPEVKEKMRERLGLAHLGVQFSIWLNSSLSSSRSDWIDQRLFGTNFADGAQRDHQLADPSARDGYRDPAHAPDALGCGHVLCRRRADRPAHRDLFGLQAYSVFDQAGTFVTMIGFSIPPFFTGVLLIVIFSVNWAGCRRSMTPPMWSIDGTASSSRCSR